MKNLLKLILFVLCCGSCWYMMSSDYDCIKMTADGSVRCSCDFKSDDEWNDFKNKTRGEVGDGWQAVVFDKNPCKVGHISAANSSTSSEPINSNQIYTGPTHIQEELSQRITEDNANVIQEPQTTIINGPIDGPEPNHERKDAVSNTSTSINKSVGQLTTVISNLEQLPNPADAVNKDLVYWITGATKQQVCDWYMKKYNAKIKDTTLSFYTFLDESDMVAQSKMKQRGTHVELQFQKVDTSIQ